mgnify:CR=1 FL=1
MRYSWKKVSMLEAMKRAGMGVRRSNSQMMAKLKKTALVQKGSFLIYSAQLGMPGCCYCCGFWFIVCLCFK